MRNRFYQESSRVLAKARVSILLPKEAKITFVKRSAVLTVPGKKDVKLSYKKMIDFLDDWYCHWLKKEGDIKEMINEINEIDLKIFRYSTSGIRLKTKKKILEAYNLGLKIMRVRDCNNSILIINKERINHGKDTKTESGI